MDTNSFGRQIHQHLLAIISIGIAIIALSYNTWRDENTERNRNYRAAGFELLMNLGELQLITNNIYYQSDKTLTKQQLMTAWGHIAMISDMSQLVPDPVPTTVEDLLQTWRADSSNLDMDESAVDAISLKIDQSRQATLKALTNLK